MHGLLSGKGRTTGAKGKSQAAAAEEGAVLDEEDLSLIRRRIAAIEQARERVMARAAAATATVVTGRGSDGKLQRGTRLRFLTRRFVRQPPREVVTRGGDALLVHPKETRTIERATSMEASAAAVLLGNGASNEQVTAARMKASGKKEERFDAATQEDVLRRIERTREVDRLILLGQEELTRLQCEKDDIQRRPNPLYNYTAAAATRSGSESLADEKRSETTRVFNFPSEELVDEYINELTMSGRLVALNHTLLWQSGSDEDDEEEEIGDDLLTPSANAKKLYETVQDTSSKRKNGKKEKRNGVRKNGKSSNNSAIGGGGSWLLRQTLGKSVSLGEKIGEAIETAAYKGVCSALMSVLARIISSLHGLNVMTHSDVRLYIESAPDLPPVGKSVFSGAVGDEKNYAEEAIKKAIRKTSRRRKKRSKRNFRQNEQDLSDDVFMQRDAVVETLISHCQISAPLLKLFPIAWRRAILGNIITLIAAVISDFADGIKLQILGHQLSFSFKPITELDMIQHIGQAGADGTFCFNHRRARPEEFEAAVQATAQDISEGLGFLEKWHERVLGGGMLRAQIGNLIARVVLTLTDEVLSGARMDLWSAQVGGPRIVAGLEYRTQDDLVRNVHPNG